MDKLKELYAKAAREYNNATPHYETCRALVMHCHAKLTRETRLIHYGDFNGRPRIPYSVFERSSEVSRPVREDIYVSGKKELTILHDQVVSRLRDENHRWSQEDYAQTNRFLYTAIISLACCFDLWQRGSRKTPGTFFEIFMAGLLQSVLSGMVFSKHIPLATMVEDSDIRPREDSLADYAGDSEERSSVSTDIVVGIPGLLGGLVVPLKITTRERIVQPFAHQRILDSAFGEGRYRSLIVCISETQLDDRTHSVKQVCVPGTIKLFQKYLAPIAGLYYCDLPQRYATTDMAKIIRVQTVGHFFEDLRRMLSEFKSRGTAD